MDYRIDAMIAGAEKAGTTSLGHYLGIHPRILSHLGPDARSPRIEFDAFASGASEDPDHFAREFRAVFPRDPKSGDFVLAKSVSLLHEADASRRLHQHNPNCRLVVSLRNPVDRAYSSYWYQRYRGAEPAATFEEALELERRRDESGVWAPHRMYVGKGRYVEHLERLVGEFGRAKLYVIMLSDLHDQPHEVLASIYDFFEVEPFWLDSSELTPRNRARAQRWPLISKLIYRESPIKEVVRRLVPAGPRRALLHRLREVGSFQRPLPTIRPETRASLVEQFAPYNRRLECFLNRDLSEWDV